jgi:hypothetical protein
MGEFFYNIIVGEPFEIIITLNPRALKEKLGKFNYRRKNSTWQTNIYKTKLPQAKLKNK